MADERDPRNAPAAEPKLRCPNPECAEPHEYAPGGWGFEVGIVRFSSMRVMSDLSFDHAFGASGPTISVRCGNCGRRVEASVETIEALLAIQLPEDGAKALEDDAPTSACAS